MIPLPSPICSNQTIFSTPICRNSAIYLSIFSISSVKLVMGNTRIEAIETSKDGVILSFKNLGLSWNSQDDYLFTTGGLFASINRLGTSHFQNPTDITSNLCTNLLTKHVSLEFGHKSIGISEEPAMEILLKKKMMKGVKIRVGNPSFRRLISGAVAGAVSRTVVAPLETIRTHLMVGSNGSSTTQVFENIMKHDGWKGLFRGNFVNVIRVAPSKAIELLAFETVKNTLTPKIGEAPKLPIPPSLIAGACAGVCSTLLTYPLELLKTRLTIERGVYRNLIHAFIKIVQEEGPNELYRGLTPSLIGVIPYAATNYYAYDSLRKAYKKAFKTDDIGNIATLLIGSAAGAISSTVTYPTEIARKQMQVGALGGRQVYKNMLHALVSIFEKEGVHGLFRGLGPNCMKLVPAAGISFMCYEACKKILIDKEDDDM